VGPRLRQWIAAFAATNVGRGLLVAVAVERPAVLAEVLGWRQARDARIALEDWPEGRVAFEDVAPLVLSSSAANRGLASMRLDEIAYLWRIAVDAGPATLIEIGRERGGSTVVLATAMSPQATLWSFDPQTKLGNDAFDRELGAVLQRFGLTDRVNLIAEDSHRADLPAGEYALVLIDGDPSVEGARLDFQRFGRRLRVGGLALFHDATPGAPRAKQLAPLLSEIEDEPGFARRLDVGTFAVFSREAG
jgi:predicted O-methyltransferase YrrM